MGTCADQSDNFPALCSWVGQRAGIGQCPCEQGQQVSARVAIEAATARRAAHVQSPQHVLQGGNDFTEACVPGVKGVPAWGSAPAGAAAGRHTHSPQQSATPYPGTARFRSSGTCKRGPSTLTLKYTSAHDRYCCLNVFRLGTSGTEHSATFLAGLRIVQD